MYREVVIAHWRGAFLLRWREDELEARMQCCCWQSLAWDEVLLLFGELMRLAGCLCQHQLVSNVQQLPSCRQGANPSTFQAGLWDQVLTGVLCV
jgi:hypothetical protein